MAMPAPEWTLKLSDVHAKLADANAELQRALVWSALTSDDRDAITQASNLIERAKLTLRIRGRRDARGAADFDASH